MSDAPVPPPAPSDVASVEVDRGRGVSVIFADGLAQRFELVDLRRNCPCATCRAQRERGMPIVTGPDLAVREAELVGAGGIRFEWSDGHRTGIFTWSLLRTWTEGDAAGLIG